MKPKEKPVGTAAERRLDRQQKKGLMLFFQATEALGEKATVRLRTKDVNITYFGHRRGRRAKSG